MFKAQLLDDFLSAFELNIVLLALAAVTNNGSSTPNASRVTTDPKISPTGVSLNGGRQACLTTLADCLREVNRSLYSAYRFTQNHHYQTAWCARSSQACMFDLASDRRSREP